MGWVYNDKRRPHASPHPSSEPCTSPKIHNQASKIIFQKHSCVSLFLELFKNLNIHRLHVVNAEAKIDTSSPFPANLNITQSSHIYIANS